MSTMTTPGQFDAHLYARLEFAWSILNPRVHCGTWKAPIDIGASQGALDALASIGMTFDALADACEFYTATTLRIESGEVPGALRLVADGYAAGPAGDH